MQRVMIIGAGLAGCAAALELSKHGIVPLMLEAQERIGGRAYSRHFAQQADAEVLEYGGSWITPYHHRIRALADELGLKLRPRAPVSQRLSWRDGAARHDFHQTPEEKAAEQRALARIAMDAALTKKGHAVDEQGRPLAGISYETYLDRVNPPRDTRHLLDAWWTVSGNGAHDAVAATEFLSSCAYGDGLAENMIEVWSHTVEPGMGVLAERMLAASGAVLRLHAPVAALTQAADHVAITLASGEVLQARQVILALGVNQMQSLKFTPPLAGLAQQAVTRGHGGQAFKLWIKARGIPLGTLISGRGSGIELLFAERDAAGGGELLIGFGLQRGDARPDDEQWVRAEFAALVPNAEFVSYDWHDWNTDPFARGTWVAAPHDLTEAFDHAAWAPQGRISFASSDIAPEQAGWFEGAVLAGEKAARGIIAQA